MSSSKQFVPLSLAVLISMGVGWEAAFKPAKAQPPDWAPAWGYWCQRRERLEGRDRARFERYCRRVRDDDRYERDDDDYDWDDDRYERDDDRYDWDDDDRYERDGFYYRGILEAGTYIDTEYSNRDRIVLRRDETLPLTLRVSRDVRDDRDRILIRRGSRIEGELRPSDDGIRFSARRLILTDGRDYRIDARSDLIRSHRDYESEDFEDTVVSRAARILIGSVLAGRSDLGNISDLGNVLERSDLGDILGDVLAGRIRTDSRLRSDLVVVYPDEDLELRLRSDLRIR